MPPIALENVLVAIRLQRIRISVDFRMRMPRTVYLSLRQAFAGLGEGRLRIHRIAWHETVLHVV